ncbi:MAG: acetyl-CoA hydrolase/transferase C-terminal domain-containing protein [Porticoccaceae bacterium]
MSRPPTELDYACAEHIATLIDDNTPIQIGVGGIIEALSDQLKTRRNLRIISGAVGETIRKLHNFGCLSPSENILGTALVGDADIIEWAKTTANLRLMSSREIHNPKWLAKIANFHSLNIALSVDLEGNVNAESIGERQISGKGGSPNFAQGAALSPGGHAIVALRGDRENSLVDKIDRPTIPGSHISYIVCENGIADLRNKSLEEKAVALKKLFKQSP